MAWYTILFITVASLFIVKLAISLFAGDIDMDVDLTVTVILIHQVHFHSKDFYISW